MSAGVTDDSMDISIGKTRNSALALEHALEKVKELKDEFEDCTIYTLGFGSNAADSAILQKSEEDGLDGNNPSVDAYYNAADADELSIAYGEILTNVTVSSQAWTVTDPMPKYVTLPQSAIDALKADTNNKVVYDAITDTLTWDLANSTPAESTDGDGNTVYSYTLTYTITVDTTELEEGEIYPTNLQTILTYAFADEQGEFPEELKTANFLVPTVTPGEKYDVSYTVTVSYVEGTEVTVAAGLTTTSTTNSEGKSGTWIFDGWTTDDATISGGKFDMPDQAVELTGTWTFTEADKYTVIYAPNGGDGTVHSVTEDVGDGHTVLEDSDVGFSRGGYIFMGWSTDPGATDAEYTGGDTIGTGAVDGDTITFYAVWRELQPQREDYYVIYYPNGGTGTPMRSGICCRVIQSAMMTETR